jgi:transglutaminase-like putative cysteine protease
MPTRTITWNDTGEKARWLDAAANYDAAAPLTRETARNLARRFDPNDQEAIARTIHAFVRDGIKYIRDPGVEEFSDSDAVLSRGYGDCDDKERVFVALCRSVGIDARIRPIHDDRGFVHVQAVVTFPGAGRCKEAIAIDGKPWLIAETIVPGVPLGSGPNAGPYGRILI